MPPASRDLVTILGTRPSTTVVIPGDSHQLLLERLEATVGLEHIVGDEDLVAAIRVVGTSRPITLTKSQKHRLIEILEGWLEEVDTTGLPQGIFELRNALIDERDAVDLDEDG